ncbi:MAG: hypothetical protein ABIH28_03420 [archaeon]
MALETKIFTVIGILGFIGALLCLSPNMTGNVIGQLSEKSTNLLGMIFLAIGIASIWITRIRD